jgi:hypothetical protein
METPFQIITGPALSKMCDYSFGDHHAGLDAIYVQKTGVVGLPDGFMKEASIHNTEFLEKCREFEDGIMTLYIDNLRLYNRPVAADEGFDTEWVQHLLDSNDLLALCKKLPNNKFIIFGHQEDTCIDNSIDIPDNVLAVYAVNCEADKDKLFPFPFGVQRQLGLNDKRQDILKDNIEKDKHIHPTKLFYISCAIHRNEERTPLVEFEGEKWATCRFDKYSHYYPYDQYQTYLDEIKDHKFIACPRGHANCYDTHKIWETLYLRRVPVMTDYPYFRRLMQGFPVLFVKNWGDVTPELLKDNDYLYQKAQKMSLKKLDLSLIYNVIVNSYENAII